MTEFIKAPDDEALIRAADVINAGGIVAFPTETVYGLGVNALDGNAAKKVYEAKGRPSDNPLIIHLASAADAKKYAKTSAAFDMLAASFMPGPLTVILPKRDCIPDSVTGGLDTVAVRVPSNFIAHRLIEFCCLPVAAPSANISGKPSCTTAEHVLHDMDGRIDMILDGGDCDFGVESTIVMICGDNSLKLLRPGAVTLEMLEEKGFKVTLDKAVTEMMGEGEKPLAPGMKYRHYAPNAKVILLNGDSDAVESFMRERSGDKGTAVICYEEDRGKIGGNCVFIGGKEHPEQQAHMLFATLRALDGREEIRTIYARLPEKDNIGLAVFNRMLKASGYTVKTL